MQHIIQASIAMPLGDVSVMNASTSESLVSQCSGALQSAAAELDGAELGGGYLKVDLKTGRKPASGGRGGFGGGRGGGGGGRGGRFGGRDGEASNCWIWLQQSCHKANS